MQRTWEISGFVITTICNVLTIAVYSYVEKLRNTLGKCVISCLFSKVIMQLCWILNVWKILEFMPIFYSYIVLIFFKGAYDVWLSVISFHLWQTFKPLRRDDHRYQFLVYSAIVWITAAGSVVYQLSLEILVFGHDLYFSIIQILPILNCIMFALTVINIRKVKREIMRFEHQKETTRTCFNFDAQTYAVYLRIFVIMGATWIFHTIVIFFIELNVVDHDLGESILYVHYNFVGIIYFVLLVLKRSTLMLLRDSIHERRNKKLVRAQRKKDLAQISKHIQRKNIVV